MFHFPLSHVTLVWDDGKRVKAHKEVYEVLGVVLNVIIKKKKNAT